MRSLFFDGGSSIFQAIDLYLLDQRKKNPLFLLLIWWRICWICFSCPKALFWANVDYTSFYKMLKLLRGDDENRNPRQGKNLLIFPCTLLLAATFSSLILPGTFAEYYPSPYSSTALLYSFFFNHFLSPCFLLPHVYNL